MNETIVIQPSRLRVASLPIFWLCMEFVFPALYIFFIHSADHIGQPFKGFFALIAIFSLGWAVHTVFQIRRIFKTEGIWKASIGDGRLVWQSALPCFGLPLDLALSDITRGERLTTITTGTDNDTFFADTYDLHLTGGRVLSFDRETAGINPHRVFKALERHGVPYEEWTQDRRRDSKNTAKVREPAT
ncbi:MAG: hypothetical protein ABJF50_18955 [Paracoccaceae bacterium]